MEIRKLIGNLIRIHRRKHFLTQKELAEKLGVTQTSLSYWESGQREPPYDVLEQICRILKFRIVFGAEEGRQQMTTEKVIAEKESTEG